MKVQPLFKAEVDELDPAHIAVASHVGGDDVLLMDGNDIIEACRTDGGQPTATLWESLSWWLNDTSGNSFEIVALLYGKLQRVRLSD